MANDKELVYTRLSEMRTREDVENFTKVLQANIAKRAELDSKRDQAFSVVLSEAEQNLESVLRYLDGLLDDHKIRNEVGTRLKEEIAPITAKLNHARINGLTDVAAHSLEEVPDTKPAAVQESLPIETNLDDVTVNLETKEVNITKEELPALEPEVTENGGKKSK